jgi:hypothetical protein
MIKVNGVKVLKKCTICKEHLPYSEFNHNKSKTDGFECYCRKCNIIKARRWRQKNRERMNEIIYSSIAKYPERQKARIVANRCFPEPQICSVQSCVELGERHHPDYTNGKDIVWLCPMHHNLVHSSNLQKNRV